MADTMTKENATLLETVVPETIEKKNMESLNTSNVEATTDSMATDSKETQPSTEMKEVCACQDAVNEDANWSAQFRRILLAGLGALAMAEEEVEKFVHRLVEKGTLAEQEGRKWVKEVVSKGYQQTRQRIDSLDGLDQIVGKLSIPSKHEFNQLANRVEELARKVEEMNKKSQS